MQCKCVRGCVRVFACVCSKSKRMRRKAKPLDLTTRPGAAHRVYDDASHCAAHGAKERYFGSFWIWSFDYVLFLWALQVEYPNMIARLKDAQKFP